jgi:hypothetical protein
MVASSWRQPAGGARFDLRGESHQQSIGGERGKVQITASSTASSSHDPYAPSPFPAA